MGQAIEVSGRWSKEANLTLKGMGINSSTNNSEMSLRACCWLMSLVERELNLAEISHKSKDLVNFRAAKARKASWDCQQATLVFLRLRTSPLFLPCLPCFYLSFSRIFQVYFMAILA